ncbi:MAG: hypothetical protein ACU836_06720 [Gammaproteobacteria bacterium]
MGKAIKATSFTCLFISYPFLSAYLAANGFANFTLLALAGLFFWRGIRATEKSWRWGAFSLTAFFIAGAYFANAYLLWLMPSLVYLGLTALFGYTLWSPPSFCERLVRLLFPEFKPGIAEYLHQVTWVWTLFFFANIFVCALLPTMASPAVWVLYTGGLVYVLMSLLVVGEWLYRHHRFPDLDIPPVLETAKFFVMNGHRLFKGDAR